MASVAQSSRPRNKKTLYHEFNQLRLFNSIETGAKMDHWHVELEGFPADAGNVMSKHGEVVGRYTCDENDYLEFIPHRETEPVVSGYMVGPFCREIAEWLDKKETQDDC
ncbi:hypothetical protein SLH49_11555 [Cognatiyoonia sp. IB215446]|uniref:hypothetical protein n=1 Tax=Cognatiyoonia sp. IB215446 TaxID=3097355 RepID=UPI002A0F863F|nr:hypothetical protein [Cognatiyoonia sp. IB215446]MDX8348620.1 hypothetical protein [Cognatiyoonia sp. IB215446]